MSASYIPVICRGYKFINKRKGRPLKNLNLFSLYTNPAVNPSDNFFIFPLGDSAITIDLGNLIDKQLNTRVLALHDWLQAHRFPGVIDIIVAYSSVSVFYDPSIVRSGKPDCRDEVYYCLKRLLERAWESTMTAGDGNSQDDGVALPSGHSFRIPVCYDGEYGPDLLWVAREKGLSREEVIRLHTSSIYHVYMVGFLPGFPYLGKTDPRLEVPRKVQPVPVTAGGVGITGFQTGIYPLNSPGGWQIIGRTPLKLFNPEADPPIRLQVGDQVQFYPISIEEFTSVAEAAFTGWKDTTGSKDNS
jgi:inhibitor of KinA